MVLEAVAVRLSWNTPFLYMWFLLSLASLIIVQCTHSFIGTLTVEALHEPALLALEEPGQVVARGVEVVG